MQGTHSSSVHRGKLLPTQEYRPNRTGGLPLRHFTLALRSGRKSVMCYWYDEVYYGYDEATRSVGRSVTFTFLLTLCAEEMGGPRVLGHHHICLLSCRVHDTSSVLPHCAPTTRILSLLFLPTLVLLSLSRISSTEVSFPSLTRLLGSSRPFSIVTCNVTTPITRSGSRRSVIVPPSLTGPDKT